MAEVTIKLVQRFQHETGASILNCIKALKETNGDTKKALKWLKEKGIL